MKSVGEILAPIAASPPSEDAEAMALIPAMLEEVARLQLEVRLIKYVRAVSERAGQNYSSWRTLPTTSLEKLLGKIRAEYDVALAEYRLLTAQTPKAKEVEDEF